MFNDMMTEILGVMAPIRKIQISQDKPDFIAEDTKETETARDQALTAAHETDSQDD